MTVLYTSRPRVLRLARSVSSRDFLFQQGFGWRVLFLLKEKSMKAKECGMI